MGCREHKIQESHLNLSCLVYSFACFFGWKTKRVVFVVWETQELKQKWRRRFRQRRDPKRRSCARWDPHRAPFRWSRSFYEPAWTLLASTSHMGPTNTTRKPSITSEPPWRTPVFSVPSCLTPRHEIYISWSLFYPFLLIVIMFIFIFIYILVADFFYIFFKSEVWFDCCWFSDSDGNRLWWIAIV